MKNIVILVGKDGRGSNMLNIIKACKNGELNAKVSAVVSPTCHNFATEEALNYGIPVVVLPYKISSYSEHLIRFIRHADIVCLAGYMKLLSPEVIQSCPVILNVHPSLLPKFGGQGMYGFAVHEAVIAAGEKESGCTIHYVNERYDEGAIIHQKRCPVHPNDTAIDLAGRVLKLEHQAYLHVLKQLCVD